jgi:outer membrane lipoprotein-sorting protein
VTQPKNKSGNWFDLTPKDPNKLYQKISLNFVDDRLNQMNIKGNLGQKTQIQFTNIKVNSKLANNLFKLKIPKNVDVISQK